MAEEQRSERGGRVLLVGACLVIVIAGLKAAASVIVLRVRDRETPRPCRAWGYPVTPVFVCLMNVFLAYSLASYRPLTTLVSLGVLLAGVPVYALTSRGRHGSRP